VSPLGPTVPWAPTGPAGPMAPAGPADPGSPCAPVAPAAPYWTSRSNWSYRTSRSSNAGWTLRTNSASSPRRTRCASGSHWTSRSGGACRARYPLSCDIPNEQALIILAACIWCDDLDLTAAVVDARENLLSVGTDRCQRQSHDECSSDSCRSRHDISPGCVQAREAH